MVEDCWKNSLMSDISERLDLHCPDHEATRHLADFIGQHLTAGGAFAMTFRLPGKVFASRRGPCERQVYAQLWTLHSASDPCQTYSVDLAHTFGSSPFFSGALAVRTTPADDCAAFVLAGNYEPRNAAVVDTLSDRTTAEHRLAQASTSYLLRSIAAYVQVASARNEAAHAGKYPSRPRTVYYDVAPATGATPAHKSSVSTLLP
jgi:hypothetical protein